MKRLSHQVELFVKANPLTLWQIIGSGKDVDKWLAPIKSCRVEGNKRYCTMEDGTLEEEILESNSETMTFRYLIPQQHLLPVENIEGTMQVKPVDEEHSKITWQWSFDAEVTNLEAVQTGFNHIGEMGIRGIETLANQKQMQSA
ncbi:MAG: SRPBCC family protein [Bacteroidota bacterium]